MGMQNTQYSSLTPLGISTTESKTSKCSSQTEGTYINTIENSSQNMYGIKSDSLNGNLSNQETSVNTISNKTTRSQISTWVPADGKQDPTKNRIIATEGIKPNANNLIPLNTDRENTEKIFVKVTTTGEKNFVVNKNDHLLIKPS